MIISIQSLPDVSECSQCIYPIQLSSDVNIVFIFKQLFRSDDIIIDIYLNEISDNNKLVSGKTLSPDSLICQPNYNLGFNYKITCNDTKGINQSINKYNLHKFYLQFTSYDGKEWDLQ